MIIREGVFTLVLLHILELKVCNLMIIKVPKCKRLNFILNKEEKRELGLKCKHSEFYS